MRKWIAIIMTLLLPLSCAACGGGTGSGTADGAGEGSAAGGNTGKQTEAVTKLARPDSAAWQYNADDDVYYQLGISYCENPADTTYETLAIFVPGAYMDAEDNGDGTYSCKINASGTVGGYTANTAPMVMPINTPGYSAMEALTEYSSFTDYTKAGLVYVHAGCRGRDAGAPAGVTDLKAAVRYIRYSDDAVPGDAESIFTFGMSGGGAQSSLMGASGDSSLYDPYLEKIGAVSGVSDTVLGSMCWCPITNLDTADEGYEWMMGPTRTGLSDEEKQISDKLAETFAAYINEAGIKDKEGNALSLSESSEGIYQAGSYYDYMKSVIEESLNHFLADTEFPYDASQAGAGGMRGGRGGGMGGFGGGKPDGNGAPSFGDGNGPSAGNGSESSSEDGSSPSFGDDQGRDGSENSAEGGQSANEAAAGQASQAEGGETGSEKSFEEMDDITRNNTESGLSLSGTYETAQDYIDALNAEGQWVTYDASSNTATISSIEDFVKAMKTASKNLGAFDQLDGGQGENTLFGYGDGKGAHFDTYLAGILEELGSDYASSYAEDLKKTDSVGNTVDTRLNMYTPLYYLLDSSEGSGTSTVAKYWRIRSGLSQGDCALSTEMNLALALENYSGVDSVDFETIWGAGHTEAERSGSSTDNFISWVNECMGK